MTSGAELLCVLALLSLRLPGHAVQRLGMFAAISRPCVICAQSALPTPTRPVTTTSSYTLYTGQGGGRVGELPVACCTCDRPLVLSSLVSTSTKQPASQPHDQHPPRSDPLDPT